MAKLVLFFVILRILHCVLMGEPVLSFWFKIFFEFIQVIGDNALIIKPGSDDLLQNVILHHPSGSFRSINAASCFWKSLDQFLVNGVFILQAAHETTANSRYFTRVESQTLIFCHTNSDGRKRWQEGCAA